MTVPKGVSPETGESAGILKVCGTCRRVRFRLTREELQLVGAVLREHGVESLRRCVANPNFKRHWKGDVDLKAAAELIRRRMRFCRAAEAPAAWTDKACFLWNPRASI